MDFDALARVFNRPPDAQCKTEARGERAADVSRETATPHNANAQPDPDDPEDNARRPEYHGASLAALRMVAGDDWPYIKDRPAALAALGLMMLTQDQRNRGIVPAHYTRPVLCATCGPVWLWSEAPARLLACPWCMATNARVTIPRPPVRCSTCRHFMPSTTTPTAGLGRCGIDAPASKTGPPLWPEARRPCADWRPRSYHQ